MKKLYETMPRSNEVVENLLWEWSVRLGVDPPKVRFWATGRAKYDSADQTIYIHDVTWAEYVDPDCTGPCFWGVILHEFAHYLDHQWNNQVGHTPEMYAILTGLTLHEDLPLAAYEKHEKEYKPLSLKQGKKAAGAAILANYKEAS